MNSVVSELTSPAGEMQIKLVMKDGAVEFFTIVVK
jgi:hypothetical protein